MGSEFPKDLKYMDSHEYVRLDGDIATIGLSHYALEQLGDLVFLELPEVGDSLERGGKSFGAIESVKAAEDLYAPVSGVVVDRNEPMVEEPENIADDPYGDGWLVKVRVENLEELEEMMSASEYQSMLEGD